MRPEVQVLPGPLPAQDEESTVRKLFVLVAAAAGAAIALGRRRQAQADSTSLWREATADASK
jgi:hypothetical protein